MTLLEVIFFTAEYYGQKFSDQVLKMYEEDLADLDPALCIAAYGRYRRDPKNTKAPMPAVIRQMVNPQENISAEIQAREIAARICAAVPKFGYCNSSEAKAFIGAHGWHVVQRQGGWSYICENLGRNLNPSTFQAQLRDQLKGSIEYGDVIEAKVLELPDKRTSQLTSTKDIFKLIDPTDKEGA